jgi:hypothetical protein
MTHETALTKALALAITAPHHRYSDALKLAYEIAELCTPAEVERAKLNAQQLVGEFENE